MEMYVHDSLEYCENFRNRLDSTYKVRYPSYDAYLLNPISIVQWISLLYLLTKYVYSYSSGLYYCKSLCLLSLYIFGLYLYCVFAS